MKDVKQGRELVINPKTVKSGESKKKNPSNNKVTSVLAILSLVFQPLSLLYHDNQHADVRLVIFQV